MNPAKPKLIYRREELMREMVDDSYGGWECALCCGYGYGKHRQSVDHEKDCPLADPNVLAIQGVTMTRPREDICGLDICKARMAGDCTVNDWTEHTHEDLQLMCRYYAGKNMQVERPI